MRYNGIDLSINAKIIQIIKGSINWKLQGVWMVVQEIMMMIATMKTNFNASHYSQGKIDATPVIFS